jgi:hypothetical protein
VAPDDTTTAGRIERIQAEIMRHRTAYWLATDAGHQAEADVHREEVDRLLDVRSLVKAGLPAVSDDA